MCFGLFWLPPAPRVTHRKHVISLYHVKHWNTLDLGGTWLQHHAPLSEESRLFFVFVPFVRPRWAEHVRDLFWLRAREEKVVSGGDVQPAPLISCVDFVCISVTSEFLFGLSQQQKRKKKKEKSFDLKRTEVHIWSRSDGSGQQKSLQCDQFCFVSWFLLLIAAVWSSISNQKNTMCPNTFCCIHMIVEFFFSGGLMEVT